MAKINFSGPECATSSAERQLTIKRHISIENKFQLPGMNSLCKSQSSSGSLSYGMSISVLSLINANYLIVKVQRHVDFNIIYSFLF